jgi:predicted dehydrogenase
MPADRIGWAIVGCGRVADRRVAPAMARAAGADLIGFCSRNLMRAAEFTGRHAAQRAYASLDEVLADDAVHAVYVATPNRLHVEQAEQCLRAGRHVLIDKPLATTTADVQKIGQLAQDVGRTASVLHQQRFHPANLHLIRLRDEASLGPIRLIRCSIGIWYTDADNWRLNPDLSGGGAAIDLGPHALDIMLQVGGPVRRVSAFTANLCFDYPVEDFCHAELEFISGAHGLVDMSYCERSYGGRIEVWGRDGSFVANGSLQQARYYHTSVRIGDPANAADVEEAVYRDAFIDAIEDVTDALRSGESPTVTIRDALNVAIVLDAIYESARSRAPVMLG